MHEKERWWEQQDPKIRAKQEEIAEAQRQSAAYWAQYLHHQGQKQKEEARMKSIEGVFKGGGTAGTGMKLAGTAMGPLSGVMQGLSLAYGAYQDKRAFDSAHRQLRAMMDELRRTSGIAITGRKGTSGAGFENIDIFGRPIA
jgi:hypothetical protein